MQIAANVCELHQRGHHVALVTDARGAKLPGKPDFLPAHVIPASKLGKNPLHWPKGVSAILEGRRMALRLFESFQPSAVVGFGGYPVFPALLEYLTVQVSDMFRDPEYYRSLRMEVLPILRTYPSLKIWVAGCSAGEEVYSLAILLREEGLLDRTLIYATDINPHALRAAESGVFAMERVAPFTENHTRSGARSSLSDYYTARYGRVVFDKSLREHMVFSDHSLATDSVFAEMHLVSCRNVLIYFERALQDRASAGRPTASSPRL